MNINATLLGQFITFAILVWFTMRYVWPPMTKAMHEREMKIAAGLEAAERSKRELEMGEQKVMAMISEAKSEASHIIEQANKRSAQFLDQAKEEAREEQKRIIALAQEEIVREVNQTKEALKKQLAILAIAGAEKIVRHHLDSAKQMALLDEFVAEI
jgi:F-type H+-transporting ATPase subunit b